MDSFKALDGFLTQIHAPPSSGFNFGAITLHMHRILEHLKAACPGSVDCLTGSEHVHEPTDDGLTRKQWYFNRMVKFMTICTRTESLKPYTRHLLSVFEYMNNDSINVSIATMSQTEPYINITFKMNNVYRTMCSPRRFLNQIKNSAVARPRSFAKYEKPEFVKDITDLIVHANSDPECVADTRALNETVRTVVESIASDDDYGDPNPGCIDEREFEEVMFKKMYRHISELSLQAEIYATNNTSAGGPYSIFMSFQTL